LVKAFDDLATAHHKDILIGNTEYDPARMKTCVSRMLQRKVDGVAIMTSEMDRSLLKDFSSRGIPLVVLDAGEVSAKVSNISVDYQAGMSEAVRHLVDLGHQEIGFITGQLKLASAKLRYRSFLLARRHCHLAADRRLITKADHSIAGGYQGLQHLLTVCPLMTAVICSNDLSAIGAMQAAYEHGLRIPGDISIVGFDDIQLSAFAHPALTTVHLPRREMANTAFMSLLRLAEMQVPAMHGEQHTLSTRLICRHSTAAPARRNAGRRRVS
jgi:DNA-binding LacI/PurR family transcriptional regulator